MELAQLGQSRTAADELHAGEVGNLREEVRAAAAEAQSKQSRLLRDHELAVEELMREHAVCKPLRRLATRLRCSAMHYTCSYDACRTGVGQRGSGSAGPGGGGAMGGGRRIRGLDRHIDYTSVKIDR